MTRLTPSFRTRRIARRLAAVLLCIGAAGCGGEVSIGFGAHFGDEPKRDHPDKPGPPRTVKETGLFLIAGDLCPTCTGSLDGRGSDARFDSPEGITADSAGNLYVAERGSSTVRMVTAQGVVTTLAGATGMQGSADGVRAAARFNNPSRLTVDGAGNLYITDSGNSTIRKLSPAGLVTTLAGQAGSCGSADGNTAFARFCNPQGIVLDRDGNLFVADTRNHTIRRIDPAGNVSTIAGRSGVCGSADGPGTAALFCEPRDIAADGWGNLYVADTANSTVRMINPKGVVTTLAGQPGQCGTANGSSTSARFCSPGGITSDFSGNLFVADTGNSTIRKIDLDNMVTTVGGVPQLPGIVLGPLPGGLDAPTGVTIHDDDSVALTSRKLVLKLVPPN
jgi:sugar lactone lactonase YvrE